MNTGWRLEKKKRWRGEVRQKPSHGEWGKSKERKERKRGRQGGWKLKGGRKKRRKRMKYAGGVGR